MKAIQFTPTEQSRLLAYSKTKDRRYPFRPTFGVFGESAEGLATLNLPGYEVRAKNTELGRQALADMRSVAQAASDEAVWDTLTAVAEELGTTAEWLFDRICRARTSNRHEGKSQNARPEVALVETGRVLWNKGEFAPPSLWALTTNAQVARYQSRPLASVKVVEVMDGYFCRYGKNDLTPAMEKAADKALKLGWNGICEVFDDKSDKKLGWTPCRFIEPVSAA